MTILYYALEANLALLLTVAFLVPGLRFASIGERHFHANGEKLLLRSALVLATLTPLVTLSLEGVLKVETTILSATAEINSLWGYIFNSLSTSGSVLTYLSLLLVVSFAIGLCQICGSIRSLSSITASSRELRRIGRLVVREGSLHQTPCSYIGQDGFTIVLPSNLRSQHKKVVLLHEIGHIRHHDLHWKWGVAILTCIFALNPAFWVWRRWHEHSCELACDQSVVMRHPVTPQDYSQSLLDLAVICSRQSERFPLTVMLFGEHSINRTGLKARIERMLASDSAEIERRWIAPLLFLLFSLNLTLTTFHVNVRPWSLVSLAEATNDNLNRMTTFGISAPYGLVLAY